MAKPKAPKTITKQPITKRQDYNREEELAEMYAASQAQIDSAGLDETLDKENEKRFLAEFRLANPTLARYVGELQPYAVKFPLEFYQEIYRLHGWPTDPENLRRRPGIVGAWTIELIYDRFPKGMVSEIRTRNPRTMSGERLHKYFQFLTEDGAVMLDQFIQEAVTLMRGCSSWSQFKNVFARESGRSWQTFLFE
ncbi:P63C domain-containing protein [Hymenobacter yonginensis]|uniref:P63C domain-containing protein n=1 Tax=Hymenobacter yonginensis TaxID=748197 RepID=A0ABY7PMU3_9BACT|nr:P63C domain-containing protein [Hymenobacter yonginensis]WBO84484.1 P63C domain-containing protein [Hymenobacter yonginensis]